MVFTFQKALSVRVFGREMASLHLVESEDRGFGWFRREKELRRSPVPATLSRSCHGEATNNVPGSSLPAPASSAGDVLLLRSGEAQDNTPTRTPTPIPERQEDTVHPKYSPVTPTTPHCSPHTPQLHPNYTQLHPKHTPCHPNCTPHTPLHPNYT